MKVRWTPTYLGEQGSLDLGLEMYRGGGLGAGPPTRGSRFTSLVAKKVPPPSERRAGIGPHEAD